MKAILIFVIVIFCIILSANDTFTILGSGASSNALGYVSLADMGSPTIISRNPAALTHVYLNSFSYSFSMNSGTAKYLFPKDVKTKYKTYLCTDFCGIAIPLNQYKIVIGLSNRLLLDKYFFYEEDAYKEDSRGGLRAVTFSVATDLLNLGDKINFDRNFSLGLNINFLGGGIETTTTHYNHLERDKTYSYSGVSFEAALFWKALKGMDLGLNIALPYTEKANIKDKISNETISRKRNYPIDMNLGAVFYINLQRLMYFDISYQEFSNTTSEINDTKSKDFQFDMLTLKTGFEMQISKKYKLRFGYAIIPSYKMVYGLQDDPSNNQKKYHTVTSGFCYSIDRSSEQNKYLKWDQFTVNVAAEIQVPQAITDTDNNNCYYSYYEKYFRLSLDITYGYDTDLFEIISSGSKKLWNKYITKK